MDHAICVLERAGYQILHEPCESVTHLLLPVPSFTAEGCVHGGGDLNDLLKQLPKDICVIGGNLIHPTLSEYNTIDLLQDPIYLAKNANITAHCAIRLAMQNLPCILEDCSVLVVGWGRIGKCLAKLLRQLGSNVTVSARKPSDRAILEALGYRTISPEDIQPTNFRLIYNTAPVMLLPKCTGNALKIDLASKPGIESKDVLWARGLPGKDAPESSGILIANTIIDILRKEQAL